MNKAHIRYLENRFVTLAKECNRYTVLTRDYFQSPYMKKDKEATLIDLINEIKEIKAPEWMTEAKNAHNIRQKLNLVHAKLCMKEKEKIDGTTCEKVIRYLNQIIDTRYPKKTKMLKLKSLHIKVAS